MDMDLLNELNALTKQLSLSIKKLAENGRVLAEAEREYKLALHTETLNQKAKGINSTLINLIIYGVPHIADLRFKKDIAEVTYNANLEHINATKLQMRIIDNQITKEFGNS